MYDTAYLNTVARTLTNEGRLTREEFEARAATWMPNNFKTLEDKTKILLFPLPEDFDFAWNAYEDLMRV